MARHRSSWLWPCALALCAATLSPAPTARAGGYDTPVLHVARHVGMGGTAIGFVDDPSAVLLNPAGLRGVRTLALLGHCALLLPQLRGSPDLGEGAESIDATTSPAALPLLAAGVRAHAWLTLGLGAYPVAAGGARYRYDNVAGSATDDETRLVFLELSPALSLNVPRDAWLPGELSLGVGHRVDVVRFERRKGPFGDPVVIDLDLSGAAATGLRLGAQYRPSPAWSFGAVFRTRVTVTAEGDAGTALDQRVDEPHADFVLPSKLGLGARFDVDRVGLGLDLEHGFYADNDDAPLRGTIDGVPGTVTNVFAWRDAQTLRAGVEYRLGAARHVPLRAGYVFDGTVSNPRFPTAFGTPPAPTHSLTLGAGYRFPDAQLNLAYAYRFGGARVSAADLAPAADCRFCSRAGDYALRMHGLYLDASFTLPE